MLVVMFPHELLNLRSDDLAKVTARRVSGRRGVGGLVSPFLVKLANELRSDQIAPTFELSSAMLDLFAAAFSEQLDCESSVRPETRRHAVLLSALGACTAITLRMYPEHQGWPLAGVDVELTYVVEDRDTRWIERLITLHGVDEGQRAKLADVAEKTPVTRVVRAGAEIRTITGEA